MNLIEVHAALGAGGTITIPKEELRAMDLETGDEICLIYLAQSDESRVNWAKEFMIEKSGC